MGKVENAVQWALNIASDTSHGYDQKNRWGPDFDCSSLVITAFEQAGIKVKSLGASYTGNMYNPFIKCGFKNIIKNIDLKTGAGLKRGDVLLKPNDHTAIYIGNNKLVHASINELGTIIGGKIGDQTGKEICERSYYNHGWTYVFRFDEIEETFCKDVNIIYCVRTQKHGWLAPVRNLEDYAGWEGSPVVGVAMKVDVGRIEYQVHLKGHPKNEWLPKVSKYDIKDVSDGYAGDGKSPIDCVKAYYYTPNGMKPLKEVIYKVNDYDWQHDVDTNRGQDGYAGDYGVPMSKLRMQIKDC